MDIKPIQFSTIPSDVPIIVAGPCSAESEQQTIETARQLSDMGIRIFRAGLWKPRTHPGDFEGIGQEGLKWMQTVKQETGMLTATEAARRDHVEAALDAGIDILWIGARTVANPFAVQEIADALHGHDNVTVFVKNPVSPDIELWIGGIQRIYNAGIRNIAAVHRGFATYAPTVYRNEPYWHIPIELHRRIPSLTILCDPSHMGGKRELVQPLSQQALDMGFNGLMIESHIRPECALSDSKQQITPKDLGAMLDTLSFRDAFQPEEILDVLRSKIDACDNELIDILARRMEVSREIGEQKRQHKIKVVQTQRYDQILKRLTAKGQMQGLKPDFVTDIMQTIHEESVKQQLD